MNKRIIFILVLLCFSISSSYALPYKYNNDYKSEAFPSAVDNRTFGIPLTDESTLIVYPKSAQDSVAVMRELWKHYTGVSVLIASADDVTDAELESHHLIVIGNIENNSKSLALYKRRVAFADAYFPGDGGVIIHPAQSIWNIKNNVIVIGVSSNDDCMNGFRIFLDLLKDKPPVIGPLHYLSTSLSIPSPPESVKSTLDAALNNAETSMAPYWTIANWGLLYYLTGERKWAEHFRDGMYMCHERAKKSGKWVTESWTNLYFNHWKLIYAWELIDDDPIFNAADRSIIEETLWGYTTFVRWLPNLDPANSPLNECRQNHTTFLALSLFYAHRYYTEKYGITGLDSMMDKVKRCFDNGQASSYRPNDDAGGYLYLAPLHMMTYDMSVGNDSFAASGRFRTLADLVIATIDNRRDPVSFGDVGGYSHRTEGSPRGRELQFLSMGAWLYDDPQYQWLYNWDARDRTISLDTMNTTKGGEENPIQMHFGADRVFTVEDMYTGVYAVPKAEEPPVRYIGVFPVVLDDSALGWSSRRTVNDNHLPRSGERYVDKISYRRNFSPDDEYMLLDGLSTYSHGHLDGNTVSRMTWKDRIWLFDLDYIKMSPKYHNGVTVTRNGVQEDPPPLTVLECAADFDKIGFTMTTARDYNGADWTRNIVWRKGKYFLFLDRITAGTSGDYRLEQRWRTRGDVTLARNQLTARQGEASFFIKSADTASRRIYLEADGSRSRWNYPYGDGQTAVCLSRKDISLSPSEHWTFASLMYAVDGQEELSKKVSRISDDLFLIEESDNHELVGLSADILKEEGVYADCPLFIQDSRTIWLMNVKSLVFGDASLNAPGPVTIEINYRQKTGRLIVPEGSTGNFSINNLFLTDMKREPVRKESVSLGSGSYQFEFSFSFRSDFWKNRVPFITRKTEAESVLPDRLPDSFKSFGIDTIDRYSPGFPITAVSKDELAVVGADSTGRIFSCRNGVIGDFARIPSGKPVSCLFAGDIDSDGENEIIAGDIAENLYCFGHGGSLRWSLKLTKYYGTDANAADITLADIDGSGKPAILVATAGWKLYALRADGSSIWEGFTYYHPQTMARLFVRKNGERFIAVGTEYHTPLNVLSPKDGHVRWHVWEEMGSEYLSTTEYCGYHLTGMVFIPAGSGHKDMIVFGTKSNTVYALDPDTGATAWSANVGGEVTTLDIVNDSKGAPVIVATNDAGDVTLLSASGETIKRVSLNYAVTSSAVLSTGVSRSEIILGLENGDVLVCDTDLVVRAAYSGGGKAVSRTLVHGVQEGDAVFSVATQEGIRTLSYRQSNLKPSRHY